MRINILKKPYFLMEKCS